MVGAVRSPVSLQNLVERLDQAANFVRCRVVYERHPQDARVEWDAHPQQDARPVEVATAHHETVLRHLPCEPGRGMVVWKD